MSRTKANSDAALLGEKQPIFTVRFLVSLLLMIAGLAWIVFYYTVVRVDPTVFPVEEAGGPKFLADLGLWNYTIGFALLFIGFAAMAHPSTPMGRGRNVVIGMLASFLLGLVWICTYYIFSGDLQAIPVMNDLGNYNLFVGIALMAVGFAYATKWE